VERPGARPPRAGYRLQARERVGIYIDEVET
jgi:hypothetical protein